MGECAEVLEVAAEDILDVGGEGGGGLGGCRVGDEGVAGEVVGGGLAESVLLGVVVELAVGAVGGVGVFGGGVGVGGEGFRGGGRGVVLVCGDGIGPRGLPGCAVTPVGGVRTSRQAEKPSGAGNACRGVLSVTRDGLVIGAGRISARQKISGQDMLANCSRTSFSRLSKIFLRSSSVRPKRHLEPARTSFQMHLLMLLNFVHGIP